MSDLPSLGFEQHENDDEEFSVEEAASDFLKTYDNQGTRRTHKCRLKPFLEFQSGFCVDLRELELYRTKQLQFVEDGTYTHEYVRKRFGTVRKFIKWLIRRGSLQSITIDELNFAVPPIEKKLSPVTEEQILARIIHEGFCT